MEKKIIVKNSITYESYKFLIDQETILVVGIGKKHIEKNKELSSKSQIKSLYSLGRKLSKTIDNYYNNINKCFKMNINPNKNDSEYFYKEVIKFIEDFQNKKHKNITHYLSISDFYKKAYYLVKNRLDIQGELLSPEEYYEFASNCLRTQLGIIGDSSNNIVWENILDKSISKIKSFLTNNKNLNYQELINYINYAPTRIDRIIINANKEQSNEKNKKLIHDFSEIMLSYFNKYGLPYWTDRKDVAEILIKRDTFNVNGIKTTRNDLDYNSKYERLNNSLPIINLLYISLTIYLLDNLWKLYSNYTDQDSINSDIVELNRLIKALDIIFDITEYENQLDQLNIFFNKAEEIDDYISTNCNSIYDFNLKIFHRKIEERSNMKTTYHYNNKTIYESCIYAAWRIFYDDYLGNVNINNPASCDDCGKSVSTEHIHYAKKVNKHLCDNCYKIYDRDLTKKRKRRFDHKTKDNNTKKTKLFKKR